MKKTALLKGAQILSAVLVIVAMLPGSAQAWAPATHTHIEKQLYKQRGQVNADILNNRIYGATALDIFNFSFDTPFPQCAAYLHDTAKPNFLKVWEHADLQPAFAYGLVSHNNTWGMDAVAHVSGITYGRGQGYVIAKAAVLATLLQETEEFKTLEDLLGGPLPDWVVQEVCHYIIEYGVDLLVLQLDPAIGQDLYTAAAGRAAAVPGLLVAAWATDPEFQALVAPMDPVAFITAAEFGFQQAMLSYGLAIASPEAAQDNITAFLTDFGLQYLGSLGIPEPVLDPLKPFVAQVVSQGLILTMTEVCAPDFRRELKAATGWVNGKLSSHGIAW